MIDKNGDRKPDYSVQIVQNGTFLTLLDYISIHNSLIKIYKADKPNDWSGILWSGYLSSIPKGEPECGWKNEHCSSKWDYCILCITCVSPHFTILAHLKCISDVLLLLKVKDFGNLSGAVIANKRGPLLDLCLDPFLLNQ